MTEKSQQQNNENLDAEIEEEIQEAIEEIEEKIEGAETPDDFNEIRQDIERLKSWLEETIKTPMAELKAEIQTLSNKVAKIRQAQKPTQETLAEPEPETIAPETLEPETEPETPAEKAKREITRL